MGDRKIWIGAAVVAVLAIVIVIGLQPRDTGVTVAFPSASATARGTASLAATAVELGIPAVWVIFNNFCFSTIRTVGTTYIGVPDSQSNRGLL